MSTSDVRIDVRLITPAQSNRVVYGLHNHRSVSKHINTDPLLMAMDAPDAMPAGSHESFDSFILPGTRIAMESTVRRGHPYPIPTYPFFKEL